MPIQTSCPSCLRPLRVPDALIGKGVRCPGCGTTWTAEAELSPKPPTEETSLPRSPESPPPESPAERGETALDTFRDAPPATEPRAPASERFREAPSESAPFPAPVPAPAPPPDYDDDDDEEDDEEFYDRLNERRRERLGRDYRADAKSRLMGPSIGLIVAGSTDVLWALYLFVNGLFTIVMAAAMPAPAAAGTRPPPLGATTAIFTVTGGIYVLGGLLVLVKAGFTIYGAIRMMKVRKYGASMAASILQIIPCCCIPIGIPFGIWGLIVLMDQKVKAAFAADSVQSAPVTVRNLDSPAGIDGEPHERRQEE